MCHHGVSDCTWNTHCCFEDQGSHECMYVCINDVGHVTLLVIVGLMEDGVFIWHWLCHLCKTWRSVCKVDVRCGEIMSCG